MNSTTSKVHTHGTARHVYYVYRVETVDEENGLDMAYYYWERSDINDNTKYGHKYVALMPLDTIAECIKDIAWVETTYTA